MTPLVVLLAALVVLPPPLSAADHQLLAVTTRGLLHLDWTGAVLGWRTAPLPAWQLGHSAAVIPQNGTVCWFHAPTVQEAAGGRVHCALLADFSQTWHLPRPRELALFQVTTLAFDWTGQTWHLTAFKMRLQGLSSFVCSYTFDRCVDVGPTTDEGQFYLSAYDMPNRKLFRLIAENDGRRRLQASHLDGSGKREIAAEIGIARDFAVDPVGRRLFWTEEEEETEEGQEGRITLYSVDYEGKGKQRVWERNGDEHVFVDIPGEAVVAWSPKYRNQIAVLGLTNDSRPAGRTQVTAIQTLAEVDDLLTLAIFSPDETTDDTSDVDVCGGCRELCVPEVVDGAASATCLCQEGEELVGLQCRRRHDVYAVVLGVDSLQIVDIQTGEVTTLLSNLTDGSRADTFYLGGEESLLFWVDAGGLYRARWSPLGLQGNVELLVPATESDHVIDLAVDWNQRQILWMTRRNGTEMVIQLSRLDGTFPKTVLTAPWADQHALAIHESGSVFTYREMLDLPGAWTVKQRAMTGAAVRRTHIITEPADIADVVVSVSLTQDQHMDRTLWLDRASRSVYLLPGTATGTLWEEDGRTTLLTHPSLAHAGGMDVLDDHLYWTDNTTGRVWTVNTATGGEPRPLAEGAGGRALRLLHRWRQPPARKQVCDSETGADCSQLCLRTVTGPWNRIVAQCACADGFQLGKDEKTCKGK